MCAPRSGNQKGSVERLVGWVKGAFFKPRKVQDEADLQEQYDNIVTNNGGPSTGNFESLDEAAWSDLIGSNLKAPLFLSQAAAPALRASSAIWSAVEERSGCGLASSLRARGFVKSMACSSLRS